MPQPVLTTRRLILEPLCDDHLELEVALDADPAVLRFLWPRPRTREEVTASHTERMAQSERVDGLGFWMAHLRNGDPVGLTMLPVAPSAAQLDDPSVSELGNRLFRRHWGHGSATEASAALLDHAFGAVGQQLVIAPTMAVNGKSRALMERLGMRHVRTFHGDWDPDVSLAAHTV